MRKVVQAVLSHNIWYGIATALAMHKSVIKTISCLLSCFLLYVANAQAQIPETPVIEQQVENLAADNEDVATEDDSYQQQLQQFLVHPLNLNTADEMALAELRLLTPLQINSLLSYRSLMGHLISIYELQAVPGWDIPTIQRLRRYVTVAISMDIKTAVWKRLKGGDHHLLLRVTQVLEKAKGFLVDTGANSFYVGSPQKILMRYRYHYKNLLQYGWVGEKDAGEQFFKGHQRLGFDFYSAHLFIRKLGIIQALALGDFTVNLGQGLTQWQGLAFRKGADVMNIKRQSAVLRPYHSAGEVNFYRGLGITLAKAWWQTTLFASYKKVDANLVSDSIDHYDAYASSLQTSGYHRTHNEMDDKGAQRQLTWGGNITWQKHGLQIGVNMVQHRFTLPLIKNNGLYQLFAPAVTQLSNYGIHYGYTYKNAHLFGEVALGDQLKKAVVSGLLVSVGAQVDMSLLYRHISPGYQAVYANAFTESSLPNNENGLYMGIHIRPSAAWRVDAYADFYRFPWLRYRVDAPSEGADFLMQATYKPNKELEIYTHYRRETKAINTPIEGAVLQPVLPQPRQHWRTQIGYQLSRALEFRSRAEMVWYGDKAVWQEQGSLLYGELLYHPWLKPFSGSIRLQYFETEGYNARLYAYEQDVLYSYSIPVFYDKGVRWYLNLRYKAGRKLSCWFRLAQTNYSNKVANGSGLDEIKGPRKTEIKLQIVYGL